jgi:hypothetical protein
MCHDANGELYMLNFSRTRVTLTSYADGAIRTGFETRADTVASRTPVKERPEQKNDSGAQSMQLTGKSIRWCMRSMG